MIGYHILCHGNFPQVAKLIEALYDPDDFFLIDIDDGQHPNTQAIEKFASLPNIHMHRDANIGWGGAGTMRKTIQGAYKLLELDSRWEYYVVLSGQDLPLKSNKTIRAELARGARTRTNFIRSVRAKHLPLADQPVHNPGNKCMMWGDRGHTKVYAKPGAINPQVGMYARTLVDVSEIGEKGEVYVGTVDPLLHRRREDFFKAHPYYSGANWFNLHRSLLEHMASDPFAYEVYDLLKHSFIPDEAYFQTYIMSSPFRDTVSQHYGRLILRPGPIPKVKVFEMEDWPTIETCSELFGRKFDTRHDIDIINTVLAARKQTQEESVA